MNSTSAKIIGGIGRFLIGTGILTLAFAGFQLWGTNLAEAQAQDTLGSSFAEALEEAKAQTEAASSAAAQPSSEPNQTDETEETEISLEPAAALDPELLPKQGEAAGTIEIPKIGVTKTFVAGVTRDDLRLGPGHYPKTPFPGQAGNAAIAGHRTTHGAPFFDIDLLEPGDEILVETIQGRFRYVVQGHPDGSGKELGHFIVPPSATEVLQDNGENMLTLTACHPKYSARQRIIVTAVLANEPAPTIELPTESEASLASPGSAGSETDPSNTIDSDEDSIAASLGWQREHATPAAVWAAFSFLVGLTAWALGRLWRKVPAYLVASPPLLWCLFIFFSHLDKFIPAV